MQRRQSFEVLGLMSGSSLDGLDLAACRFEPSYKTDGTLILDWELLACDTLPFPAEWHKKLRGAPRLSASKLIATHTAFGRFLGIQSKDFIKRHQLHPDFISSHGHTVFHHPEHSFTLQIGDGAAIAAINMIPVIADFRTQDIALGGQGTPIAPAADKYLFPGYDFYLNIGGISNITSTLGNNLIAFDIAPANQVLNFLSQQVGQAYDKNGQMARSGKLIPALKDALNDFDYYKNPFPKSLDNQWIKKNVLPVFEQYDCSIPNKLHTASIQQAEQITKVIKELRAKHPGNSRMLVTGGGAFNKFLMAKINERTTTKAELPKPEIIAFKEAILMGLMGLLRWLNIPNCFASVTGAERDTVGGCIWV